MNRYIEYNDELLPIDEVLNKLDNEIGEKDETIDQLTNNWNELEEWLKDFKRLYEDNEFQNNAKFCITVDQVLNKMKEIKGGNNG